MPLSFPFLRVKRKAGMPLFLMKAVQEIVNLFELV